MQTKTTLFEVKTFVEITTCSCGGELELNIDRDENAYLRCLKCHDCGPYEGPLKRGLPSCDTYGGNLFVKKRVEKLVEVGDR